MTTERDLKGSLLVAAMRLAGRLPFSTLGAIGSGLGPLAWRLAPGARKVTLKNLELCLPELSEEQRQQLARDSLKETLRTALEMVAAWTQPNARILQRITHADNEHLLEQALARGQGVVLVVPHFGNWELCNYYMSHKCDLMAMYKPVASPALDRLIYGARSHNTQMVAADKRGVIALFRGLAQGKVTGVLPDQEPERKSGVWAPFFGIPALTPILVSKLANDTGSLALGYGCQRNPDGKTFHVFYEPMDADFYTDDIQQSAAAMNRCVERIIRRDPAQYQWEYKRFKRRPDKQPSFYK